MRLPWQRQPRDLNSPRDLANLALWLDANDTSVLRNDAGAVPATSDGIKLVSDKSGNSAVNVLALSGTTAGNGASLTTGTAIGTGAFTRSIKFIVPPAALANVQGVGGFYAASAGFANVAGEVYLAINTTGQVRFNIRNDAGSGNSLALLVSNFISTYAGQAVVLQAVRNGTACELFVNGASIGSGTASETTSINSTVTATGYVSAGELMGGAIIWDRSYSAALGGAALVADAAGTVQADNIVNVNFPSASKLASSFVCATGQTVTINSTGATGARICGARDSYQGVAANQPVLTIAATGNYLTFDGSNDYLKAAAFPLAQPTTVYLVGSQVTWTSGDYILDGNSLASGAILQNVGTPTIQIHAGSNTANNAGWAVGTNAVITAVFNGAASSDRVNRLAAVVANAGAGNMGGLTLGAAGNASAPANITVSAVLVYAAAHDFSTQNRVINLLARLCKVAIA